MRPDKLRRNSARTSPYRYATEVNNEASLEDTTDAKQFRGLLRSDADIMIR